MGAIDYSKREMLKLTEVEEAYGIPIETVRKWIKRTGVDGIPPLKAFKPGRDLLISKKELDSYIKRFEVK